MTGKLVTCWLLLALGAGAALAQTHPKKKTGRKHAVVRQPVAKTVVVPSYEQWGCIEPLLPPVNDYVETVALPDSAKVYTYVEQMPTLNGQNTYAASVAAINQRLVVPAAAPDGRVFVRFEVTKKGYVRHPEIVKGLRADLDSAVVTAVRQLPRFTPGRQSGHVVAVSFTLPVTIPVRKQP